VGEGFSSDGENGSRRKGEKEKGKNLGMELLVNTF